MSAVRIVFDELAQRWEFSRPARAASSDLVEERTDVFVGRDGGGAVVEVVVDVDGVVVPTGAALDTVVGAFGEGIGPVLDGLDLSDGVDVIVEIAPRSALEVPRGSVVPGEPGVLTARTDGGFDVRVGDEVAHVEVTDTGIEVRLADRGREGLWVRVSDNESGTLLALGPLRRAGTARRASITFGLTVGPDDTVFSVTGDPLAPVAPRPQRRRDWVDELLERASHERLTRPLRALHHAHEARRVSDAIDDGGRKRRAESSVRRSRLTIGAGAVLVLVALGASAWWVVGGGGDDDTTQADPVAATVVSPPVVAPSVVPPPVTAVDSTTVPAVSSVPEQVPPEAGQPNGGSSDYRFADAAAVVVALDGSTSVRSGDTLLLTATGSITVPNWSFGPRPGEVEPSDAEEELARAVCLSAVDVPASGSTFLPPLDTEIQVRLRAIDSSETIGVGTVVLSAPIRSTSAVTESCLAAEMTADGSFRASMVATRNSEQVAVTLPADLAPGRWIVDLSTIDGAGTSDTPIVIDIED